jgi:hypothetical protein
MKTLNAVSKNKTRTHRHRAHMINGQFKCSCGSQKFTIHREKVARKVRTRTAHRRRTVAICENNHKTRVAFT